MKCLDSAQHRIRCSVSFSSFYYHLPSRIYSFRPSPKLRKPQHPCSQGQGKEDLESWQMGIGSGNEKGVSLSNHTCLPVPQEPQVLREEIRPELQVGPRCLRGWRAGKEGPHQARSWGPWPYLLLSLPPWSLGQRTVPVQAWKYHKYQKLKSSLFGRPQHKTNQQDPAINLH